MDGVVKFKYTGATNCQNGKSYTLTGPFQWISGWNGVFVVGNTYTIEQISDQLEQEYLRLQNPYCDSSTSCKENRIGRIDVYQRGYDSSGTFINFNRNYAALYKCSLNPPNSSVSYGSGFIRYSLNLNGCGYI